MSLFRTATADDVELVGAVAAAGFAADPVMHWLWQDPATFEERNTSTFLGLAATFLDGTGVVDVLDDAAVALWRAPDFDHAAARAAEDEADEGGDFTADELDRLAILGAAMSEAHPHEPHWYLNVVATLPAQVGRGLGTALLLPALARADADRLPCYLESSNPRNRTLYRRLGFVETGELPLGPGASLVPMWREAR